MQYDCYNNPYGYGCKNIEKSLDLSSQEKIDNLNIDDIKNVNMIKSLKRIENGLGVLIFVFHLIFLAAEIVYLVFIRGIREYQLLPIKI